MVALVFFTAYLNFNHLQYHTDFYVRKYGYIDQYAREDAGCLQDKGEWDLTQADREVYGDRK